MFFLVNDTFVVYSQKGQNVATLVTSSKQEDFPVLLFLRHLWLQQWPWCLKKCSCRLSVSYSVCRLKSVVLFTLDTNKWVGVERKKNNGRIANPAVDFDNQNQKLISINFRFIMTALKIIMMNLFLILFPLSTVGGSKYWSEKTDQFECCWAISHLFSPLKIRCLTNGIGGIHSGVLHELRETH